MSICEVLAPSFEALIKLCSTLLGVKVMLDQTGTLYVQEWSLHGIPHARCARNISLGGVYLSLGELLILALQVCIVLPLQLHLVLKVSLHTGMLSAIMMQQYKACHRDTW